jgi:outer membrane protein
MKKYLLCLFGVLGSMLGYAEEADPQKRNVTLSGNDVANHPYSVEKQYAKADEIKKDNNFYNLKKASEVAMVGDTEEKLYSLISIYELAAAHNAEYQQARSTFASNVETVPQALGGLLPRADITYNLRKDTYNQFGGIIGDTSNNFTFSGSQVLFDWAKWKTYTRATYLQKSYAMIFAKAEQNLIVSTTTSYFELLRTEQSLEFQLANEAWNKKVYITQEYQYNAGTVSYADLKTADASYRKSTAERIDAQRALISSKATMAKLLGKRISSILYISNDSQFLPPSPNNIEFWIKTSEQSNLDVSQKSFEYQAATEGVGIQWGNFFPVVNFNIGVNMSRNNLSGDPEATKNIPKKYDVANVGGSVSWNILKGGSDYAQLKQASYDNQAANYALLQTKREVYAGSVESFQTVTLDVVKIEAYKKSVNAGLASVKAIQEGFEAGTQTIVDLLNRQSVLVQAQLSFAGAIFDYIEHYVQLKQIQGTLTPKDIKEINTILGKTNIISQISVE